MKLSDYVATFLAEQGISHVFAITGGASLHLIHSIADSQHNIDYVCPQHEQAGAMAADAYSRVTGKIGAAIATSGPGATNMITGICCAYYDSIPVLYITGQVSTFRFKGETGVRQLGFQETDIVNICKPITKYCVLLKDPLRVKYELEKACWLANHGRHGPVLIDIPDNIQREEIDVESLVGFSPSNEGYSLPRKKLPGEKIKNCVKLITEAKRPVVVLGVGVKLAKAENQALNFIERVGAPVLLTWGALDILPSNHNFFAGTFGTHGTRYGNFTIQNADFVLSIGSRLDTHEVGSPFTSFARNAKKVMVDIDISEIMKFHSFGVEIDIEILADAKDFLENANRYIEDNKDNINFPDISVWYRTVKKWKKSYPIVHAEYYIEKSLNPYVFVKTLSDSADRNSIFVVDTGNSIAWMSQAFEIKKGQQYFHAFNNTPMGYALPAAIGAAIGAPNRNVICVTGDGGLQMNLQELATVIRQKLPIKIFLFNNHGYSMIKQTQDQWLNSKYIGSSVKGGLAFPDFFELAKIYGFYTITISENLNLKEKIDQCLSYEGPVFVNLEISPDARVIPQVKYGRPIEDAEPLLPRDIFHNEMIIEAMDVSK